MDDERRLFWGRIALIVILCGGGLFFAWMTTTDLAPAQQQDGRQAILPAFGIGLICGAIGLLVDRGPVFVDPQTRDANREEWKRKSRPMVWASAGFGVAAQHFLPGPILPALLAGMGGFTLAVFGGGLIRYQRSRLRR